MKQEKLNKILADHKKWVEGVDGQRADLFRADLRGADLFRADLRGANLRGADLRGADLSAADLSRADLIDADLRGANLRGANLRGADLSGADLSRANLIDANLIDANLRGAKGLPQAPVIKNIDQQILTAIQSGSELDMGNWHTCETTHCRAGWAIHLAGKAGYELEKETTPYLAGKLVYEASRPEIPAPDFFATNEVAFEDIRKCAKK